MAERKKKGSVSFRVDTAHEIDQPVVAYLYDRAGELVDRGTVEKGKVTLDASESAVLAGRLLFAPDVGETPSLRTLEKSNAFEPLIGVAELPDVIDIPDVIIDLWPLCICFVKGRVVRTDGRPVCDARVHVCEVDRIPWVIAQLPDLEILRLRDDLLEALEHRLPRLDQPPVPPGPRPMFRFDTEALGSVHEAKAQPFDTDGLQLASLNSDAVPVVRAALSLHYQLIIPYLCLWPWWWPWFRCDEVRVFDTDEAGRFQGFIVHDCDDQPDLYFWVEFDFGSGFETIHRPLIACNTHWNYQCGTDVTITVYDQRVPACDGEGELPGCQVNVLSIGRTVSISEVDGVSGLVDGAPFGGSLEPRVDFSRKALIDDKNIPYYRWSYRRLTGPDGVTPDVGPWTVLDATVYRHFKEVIGTTTQYTPYLLGPLPASEAPPLPNLFRIRPLDSPSGDEWRVLNERVDLATAHFQTTALATTPVTQGNPDDGAGLYELKLELFDSSGAVVNWDTEGITLNIAQEDAPFVGVVTATAAPAHNRLEDGAGDLVGFRMVVRVDNNRCSGEIHPVGGTITPDPDCGFHRYSALSDQVELSFDASHPNGFATFEFDLVRGATTNVAIAATDGTVGQAPSNAYGGPAGDTYSKTFSVNSLVGTCPNAAFAEDLHVRAMAQDGYTTLTGYNDHDVAGFALSPQP